MSLIKKTIILLKKTPVGYLTVVRVGNETGGKIVGDIFNSNQKALIKIGLNTINVSLIGKKTEFDINIPLNSTDEIGCVIYENNSVIATGGKQIPLKEFLYRENNIPQSKPQENESKTDDDKEEKVINKESEDLSENVNKNKSIEEEQQTSGDSVDEEVSTTNSNKSTEEFSANDKKDNSAEEEERNKTEGDKPTENEIRTDKKNEDKSDFSEKKLPEEEVCESFEGKTRTKNKEKVRKERLSGDIKEETEENYDDSEEREMFNRLSKGKSGFYIGISDKVDEMFIVYPSEKRLSEAIPDSEWVKINYDREDYYVIGRLKEKGKVVYLGYGVPGVEGVRPPKIADGIANWFPLKIDGYDGYWLFFQNAETGRID